jgi:predicted RNA-binding Zn ribbon-like protein
MAKKAPPARGPQLELAGDLSVAFVNTAGAREDNRQLDVGSYAELLAWGRQAGVLSAVEVERLGRRAAERPADAKTAFGWIAKVRSCLSRVFVAIEKGEEWPAGEHATVNEALAAAMPGIRLVPGEKGVTVDWAGDEDALDRMLAPVLFSAFQLLLSLEGRPHVRRCAGPGCDLFFVDATPSGRRRWCDMKTCGSRVKALRYYHKRGKKNRPRNWLYKNYR